MSAAERHGFSRRVFLTGSAAVGMLAAKPFAASAAELVPTPPQTAGPFYPPVLPLDADNDLVQIAGRQNRAKGEILHVGGRVLDASGRPIADVLVEIWQADANGTYRHPRDPGEKEPGFQGYGRTLTAAGGLYRFRTIRPVIYGDRAPHIHFAISGAGFERMTTQMYVAGEARNAADFVLSRIADPKARASVAVALSAAPEIEPAASKAQFDIVLGHNAVVPS